MGRPTPFVTLAGDDRYVRKADGSNRQFRARLHAGYSFATSLRFKPVYACLRRFKNRSGGRFVHFREPARKLLNTNELVQHLEIALPNLGSEVQVLSGTPVKSKTYVQKHSRYPVLCTALGMH